MPKISIIVPIYNVEKYLDRCIESILSQTYSDFELLLIDDGSPDNCPSMCDSWAEKDSRIKVIHKENGGLSSARNMGLDICQGEYVAFVDSDDWIHKDMYCDLIELIEQYEADLAECGFIRVNNFSVLEQPPLEIFKTNFLDGSQAFFDGSGVASIIACNKLFKKDLFEGCRFPEGLLNEDQWLIPKIYLKCKSIVYTNQIYYYYYQSPNSIMRSSFNKKRLDALKAFEETRNLYLENGFLDLVQWCDATYSFLLIKYYNKTLSDLHDKNTAKKIKKCFNKRLIEYLKNKHLNNKQKILLVLYFFIPKLCPYI